MSERTKHFHADLVAVVVLLASTCVGSHAATLLDRTAQVAALSGVNYFFGLTTTISPYQRQLLLESSAARSARRRAKPACGPVSVLREKPWRWESGKTCFWFFHFSIRPRRRSCGNVGISPAVGEISKGLVERGGSLLLAFHAFHSPGISTALFPGVFCFGRRPQTHSASPWLSAC